MGKKFTNAIQKALKNFWFVAQTKLSQKAEQDLEILFNLQQILPLLVMSWCTLYTGKIYNKT